MKKITVIKCLLTLLVGIGNISLCRGRGGGGGGGFHGGGHRNSSMSHMGYSSRARTTGAYSRTPASKATGASRGASQRRVGTGTHAGRGYAHGGSQGWNRGWGWGRGGWLWGATAAIILGTWLFAGYTYEQWQQMANEDEEKQAYFQTVVQPAYEQYQENPSSVPIREQEKAY